MLLCFKDLCQCQRAVDVVAHHQDSPARPDDRGGGRLACRSEISPSTCVYLEALVSRLASTCVRPWRSRELTCFVLTELTQ
jgi:hypothetical protein